MHRTVSRWTNTHIPLIEGLVDRMISFGCPFDYMDFPDRNHRLREPDGTSTRVRIHTLRFLLDNLPSGPRLDPAI